jgi:predicted GIY-YIG superfamily endonuclease
MYFGEGERVKHPMKPEWGVGHVLADGSIFFVNVGRRKVDFGIAKLIRVFGKEAEQPLLDICNEVEGIGEGHHNVYVIELSKDVLNIHKFRDANPYHDSSKPCLYVGVTGITPEERFENHKAGYKSSYFPKKFGVRLLPDFFKWLNPLPYEEAARIESVFADKLRLQGYAVWQN